jgi:hypothetical protein
LKNLAKGGNFVTGHGAIGLGHLGTERNRGNCERDPAPRVPVRFVTMNVRRQPAWDEARGARQQVTEWAAKRQVAGASDDAANKAHRISRRRGERVDKSWRDPFD